MGLILVFFSAAAQPSLGPFPGWAALLPVAGAALVLQYPAQGWAGQLLTSKPMVWIGELSYSLYLWHWPVLALFRYYTGAQILDLSFSLLFAALTLLLSVASFYLVETPLRTHRTTIRQMFGYGVLASGVLVTNFSMAAINQSRPMPIEYERYADPSLICHGQIVGACLKGDLNSSKEVLVLGDSHAAMLNLLFDKLGKELHFKARIITASSCVTIPGFDYQRIDEWAQRPCLDQIDQVEKYLPTAKVIFLAASWSWQLKSDAFKKALGEFLTDQDRNGVRVYIFEQEPLLSENPLRSIRFKALGLASTVSIDPAYRHANAVLEQIAGRHLSATTLNFEASGFFSHAPFFAGEPIYLDSHHLNENGVKHYADVVRSVVQRIVE